MGSLDGQVAVVTGANRRLGAEIAVALAAAGADLALCKRERSTLSETQAAAAIHGGHVLALRTSTSPPDW